LVYCDGSEFYPAGFSSTGGTITGNLTVTGTTTLATATASTPTTGDNTTKIATTAFVQTALQALYPIGSIYTATVATNPATLFGFGTWTAYGAGRVLIGNGGGYSAGATGGSADAVVVSHNHTASSSSSVSDPGHAHSYSQSTFFGAPGPIENGGEWRVTNASTATSSVGTGITVGTSTSITAAGVSGTNANLQPYVVVYMWNRTG
jgi:hypothetical protein